MKTYTRILILVLALALFSFQAMAISDSIDLGEYTVDYEYNDQKAEPGKRLTLTITLTNIEDKTLSDIEFSIREQYPFYVFGNDYFELDELESGDSKTKSFRIEIDPSAKDDIYDLEFEIQDDDEDYDGFIEIDIDSIVPEIIVGDVESSPTTLIPDLEDIKLTITLSNVGEGDAHYVQSKLNLPKGFTPSSSYSDTSNIGLLEEGENKEVVFYVDTEKNMRDGLYQGSLTLSYEDEDGKNKQETVVVDLPVRGKPLFTVVGVKTTPEHLYPGSKVQMSITVQNTGSEEGKETSIRVFENSDLPVEYDEKTYFIGSLKPGTSGTGIFSMEIDSDAKPNSYVLKIQTRTVNQGDVIVAEKSIQITVKERIRGNSFDFTKTLLIALIVLVIVFIIVLYAVLLKRKKRRSSSQTLLQGKQR
ncbi:MAG: hypothetical protein GY861_10720 [bacterium]|nr:hypothetical protein [bacterium]